ncbi:MBL fold metallo-hydrolase [Bacillus sp. Marseille-Q1617]|uniref:MBL fold metallo-hydrolase n=1 Tax=Bacillus sp. Marseille-Q1617 TaxID=2736887 RepID=UPI0015883228|nr:MBL fold metallo-hydrolase [Bacillus sp. Marseille-Q1617]
MKLQQFTDHCFAFTGAVNIGYCQKGGKGLLIDTGLDESSIKKVLKIVNQHSLPLDYCIITHAHADHFGGAAYLKRERDIILYAPGLESSIMAHPVLEPIYLFNGANPIEELRNKFLEGPSVEVDGEIMSGNNIIGPFNIHALDLPGHSYAQKGLLIEEILYAGDGYFGGEALDKHVIPFIIDADQTISSLEKLLNIQCKGAIPGHGIFEENFQDTIRQNHKVHTDRLSALYELIEGKEHGVSLEKLTKEFLTLHNLDVKSLGQWLLFRTSVTAYLASLERKKRIKFIVRDNEPRVAAAD